MLNRFELIVFSWLLIMSITTSATLTNYYFTSSTSDIIYNGQSSLVDDCNSEALSGTLRVCPVPSRLADNVTLEGEQFDSTKFIGWRSDDVLLIFEFPDTHITRVDIYFYNNPGMGFGLPPLQSGSYTFSSLDFEMNAIAIGVSFINNSHFSQNDNSVAVASIAIASDPFDSPFSLFRLIFEGLSTINRTYISEVKLFSETDGIPDFTPIQFLSKQSSMVVYGLNDNVPSPIDLSCSVANDGSFSITWTGPNGAMLNNASTKIYSADLSRTSILRISQVSLMDNGTYSCEASYIHFSAMDIDSATATITLALEGSVSHPDTVQTVVGEESIVLHCNFTGYLPSTPNVIWRDDEGTLLEDSIDGYNISTSMDGPGQANIGGITMNSGVTSVLTINNIMGSDLDTQYICMMEGTNIQGTIQLVERTELSSTDQGSTVLSTSAVRGSDTANLLTTNHTVGSTNTAVHTVVRSSDIANLPTTSTTHTVGSTNTAATSAGSIDSTAVIVGGAVGVAVLLATSLMMVLAFSLFIYFRKSKNRAKASDISLVTIGHGTKTESITAHEYVDVDAEIQKELEDRLSNSLIDKARLELVEKLGEGEFGVVFRGLLSDLTTNSTRLVAVKTLKGSFKQSNIDGIINEALMMKSFNHLNVLALTGVCLNLKEAPCIVMPFMNEGSLLSYLKREKSNLVVSKLADDKISSETTKRLLSMCLQVANGMAYLARMKFVHRDLASRNCMISSDGIIKVADFGLSEDIYETEYFKDSKSNIKLPIKWMAIESIYYKIFNEKTDVWSYGVLCWEVFSAGLTPYSTMSPKDVISTLNEGGRLEKPSNAACSEEIYSTMLSCWNESSDERPTFAELINKLEYLIAPLAHYMDFTELYTYIK